MKAIEIAGRTVGPGAPAAIVAEIGNNHNGDVEIAVKLIEAAAKAGCDMVKLQTHIAAAEMLWDDTVPPHFSEPRWNFFERMQLSRDDHIRLQKCADDNGVVFFSSPFSVEAAELLESIGVPCYKVASGEVSNIPLLEYVAARGKPVIISSGMSPLDELRQAVATVRAVNDRIVLLHCTSNYPCPFELMGLNMINGLRQEFDLPVGYSDHSSVAYTSVAAVALGACMIERHFTLDKTMYGPDHKASLTPDEMAEMVTEIRNIEKAMGTGRKELTPDAGRFREVFTHSIVSLTDIPRGTVITAGMLGSKKPGKGMPSSRLKEVIGKKAREHIPADVMIAEDQIEW